MWILLAVLSALLLGIYDVAKKQALRKNGVLAVLLGATALTTVFLSPFLRLGPLNDHLQLVLKAVLVTASWVSGLAGLQRLPLTTSSTIKGSRPVFVVLFSIILFGERLDWMQWAGVVLVIAALFLVRHTSRDDGPQQSRRAGFLWMGLSVLTGVASALYDKHIMAGMEPLFVQSWTNLYITVLLVLCVLAQRLVSGTRFTIRWDWMLLLLAVIITASDAMYFYALKQPDALLSIISVIRRASVLVSFILGAIIFKEGGLRGKTLNMLLMAAGVILIVFGS